MIDLRQVPVLLRGEPGSMRSWLQEHGSGRVWFFVGLIFIGSGLFGAALGSWRDPRQAGYTAIKLPLILLLTSVGNGLLNAMLAPLLGANLSLRQSLLAVLMSFAIVAVILGAFSPLLWFLIWNAPPLLAGASTNASTHSLVLLCETGMIAFAGVVANARLFHLLQEVGGSPKGARNVLMAWLAGNLLLGSQLAWILRPFVGSPSLDVEFVRPNALEGNFFEAVLHHAANLFSF